MTHGSAIRSALGANPRRIVGEVFSRAIVQLVSGTRLGLGLGIVVVGGALFAHGPGPVVGIATVILIMGLSACGRPVSRALRIQPTEALREGGAENGARRTTAEPHEPHPLVSSSRKSAELEERAQRCSNLAII